jgi:hypothetical protein
MTPSSSPQRSRRKFLLGAFVLAGGALGAVPSLRRNFVSLSGRMWRARRSTAQQLLAHYDYLRVSNEVAELYVSEYRAKVRDLGRLDDPGNDFYTRFLLSTDFFQHGADEARELQFVALYAPSITLCYNPLARME